MAPDTEKTTIENVGQPGKTYRVDAAKYEAVRKAVLKVLPSKAPGITVEATIASVSNICRPTCFLAVKRLAGG